MVNIRTHQPNKEMQRRGIMGAEAKKNSKAGGQKSYFSGISSDLFEDDADDIFDDEPGDGNHGDINSYDSIEFEDEGFMTPTPPRRTQSKPDHAVSSAVKVAKDALAKRKNDGHTGLLPVNPATRPSDLATKATNKEDKLLKQMMSEFTTKASSQTAKAPSQAAKAPSQAAKAPSQATTAPSQATTAPPQGAKATHPIDTDSDTPKKKKVKTDNPPEETVIEFPAAPTPTKAPASPNLEDVVYKSSTCTFTAKFQKTTDAQVDAFWTDFQNQVQQARTSIYHDVFGSPLTREDLDLLDMKSASYLFPTLVNNAGELRTRAEKAQKSEKDLLESLKDKKKTFKDISTAALRQANRIQETISELEASMMKKNGAASQKKLEERCKSEISTKATLAAVIDAIPPQLSPSEFIRLSATLADHVTSIAERYRQELSPMVMYIRRMATVLACNEQRLLQLRQLFSQVLQNQNDNAKSYFWPKYLEEVASGVHLCQCEECMAKQKSMKAAESLTEASTKMENLACPKEYDYRNPDTVYNQPHTKLPDLSHLKLTSAQMEDANFWCKKSKYTFRQCNGLLDSAHEQYQEEIREMEEYERSEAEKEIAEMRAQTSKSVRAANEASAQREKNLKENRPHDLRRAAEAAAAIGAFIQEEVEAYQSLPTKQKDRNYLTLEERRAKIDYNYRKERAEIEWQTKLQYAEDIQGAFFDHVITDPKEFEEIIREHEASGRPDPEPLDRTKKEEESAFIRD